MITLEDFLFFNRIEDLEILKILNDSRNFKEIRFIKDEISIGEKIILSPKSIYKYLYKKNKYSRTNPSFRNNLNNMYSLGILNSYDGGVLREFLVNKDSDNFRISGRVNYYSSNLESSEIDFVINTIDYLKKNNIDYFKTIGQSFMGEENLFNRKKNNLNRWNILYHISKNDLTSTELEKKMKVDRHSIFKNLKELENIGFIKKYELRNRSVLSKKYKLTNDGQLFYENVVEKAYQIFFKN